MPRPSEHHDVTRPLSAAEADELAEVARLFGIGSRLRLLWAMLDGGRTRAGRRLGQPRAVADGAHARADAYVSLAVLASAAALAVGLDVADPPTGLAITLVILRITWQSCAPCAATTATRPTEGRRAGASGPGASAVYR